MIRIARESDAAALLAIYAQYIGTPITFEYTLPDEAEFARRIRDVLSFYPYLVCEEDGRIVGYAYAHRYRERAAYGWDAELSVYLDAAYTGRGIGRRLYGALNDLLVKQGIRNLYARVTHPNEKSERLHRAMGFTLAGVERATGYKNGNWWDMQIFEKQIRFEDGEPAPVVPFPETDRSASAEILRKYM